MSEVSGAKIRPRSLERHQVNIDNFYKYTNPDPNTGCWLWSGYTMPNGYGHFSIGTKSHLAHRVSYLYFKGQPGNLYVCHKCDNPYCVNPEHLFLGTHQDNIRDMVSKGRNKKVRTNFFCKHGHNKVGDNAYYHSGRLSCKECKRTQNIKRNAIKKESKCQK